MAQLLGIKKVPPVPVDKIEYVDLRLTGGEANALYDILCVIGGSPGMTRRVHMASLFATLREAYPRRNCQRSSDLEGSLYFQPRSK